MIKKIFLTVWASCMCLSSFTQNAAFTYFSYQGNDARFNKTIDSNNQYFNPILAGFYPDPSVCRVGDTYYLATSTFSLCPGVPIFSSKDLVNWTQLGYALNNQSDIPLNQAEVSAGIFAPAISYCEKNRTFYLVTMDMTNYSVFYVKSKDPSKGWSAPIRLKAGGMDPSFFFEKDGRAYMVYNTRPFGGQRYKDEMAIHMNEFFIDGDSVSTKAVELVRGGANIETKPVWIEGPHLYKVGKYYYLMCAQGGTGSGHSEVIFRSEHVNGPWEDNPDNPILTQVNQQDKTDEVSSTGHADIVEAPDGSWWAVFLGCRPYEADYYHTGRDTYLLPVSWKDGWPTILEKGKKVPTVVNKSQLKPKQHQWTGNFSYTDHFEDKVLDQRWMTLRNPLNDFYRLTKSGITFKASNTNLYQKEQIAALFRRQQHATFRVETELIYQPLTENDFAGLVAFQNEQFNFSFGKTMLNGVSMLVVTRTEKATEIIGKACLEEGNELTSVKLRINGEGRYYNFEYKIGEQPWTLLASKIDGTNLSTHKAGGFIGTVLGIYATNQKGFLVE